MVCFNTRPATMCRRWATVATATLQRICCQYVGAHKPVPASKSNRSPTSVITRWRCRQTKKYINANVVYATVPRHCWINHKRLRVSEAFRMPCWRELLWCFSILQIEKQIRANTANHNLANLVAWCVLDIATKLRDSKASHNFRTFRAVAHSLNSVIVLIVFFYIIQHKLYKNDTWQHGKQ